jgi:hypothetical protein
MPERVEQINRPDAKQAKMEAQGARDGLMAEESKQAANGNPVLFSTARKMPIKTNLHPNTANPSHRACK